MIYMCRKSIYLWNINVKLSKNIKDKLYIKVKYTF